jgi:hypothetical protein
MNKLTGTLTVGSDPELLIKHRVTGEVLSAIDVLQHGKEDKIDLKDGFMVYYDNVLAETNVPYAFNAAGLIKNVRETFARIANYIGKNYELDARASHTFTPEQCAHEDARVFGCNPEYCAYSLEAATPPSGEDGNTFRSAGGHIHIGRSDFKKPKGNTDFLLDPFSKVDMVKVMDILVGLPIVLMDNDPTSPARKKLYGSAGRHRPTPYGVEYRTPGNFWLSNPDLCALIYDLSTHAAGVLERNEHQSLYNVLPEPKVVEAINKNDKKGAEKLLSAANLPAALVERIKTQAQKPMTPLYSAWGIK